MKIKVINSNNADYNKEFKVRRMNYDQTVVNYPNNEGLNIFLNKDVEFIAESEIDEFLIKNKEVLQIKLTRGISVFFYKIILEVVEEYLKEKFKDLNLLKDKYSVNKRNIWSKDIICIINNKYPIKIVASGQNFKKVGYSINVEQINIEEFLELCKFEVKKIEKNIKYKELELHRYKQAVNSIKSRVNIDDITIVE